MYCTKCGTQIQTGQYHCPNCGNPVSVTDSDFACDNYEVAKYNFPPQRKGPWNSFASAGHILGLVSIITCWIPIIGFFACITGTVGIVMASLGKRSTEDAFIRKASIGLTLSIVGMIVGIIVYVLFLIFVEMVPSALDPLALE